MQDVRWTKAQPYILEYTNEQTSVRGPFNLRAVASYAAKVIRGHSERGQGLTLAVFSVGAMIVEAAVDNHGECKVNIADADIYDASPPEHRAEIDFLCAACYNAARA